MLEEVAEDYEGKKRRKKRKFFRLIYRFFFFLGFVAVFRMPPGHIFKLFPQSEE